MRLHLPLLLSAQLAGIVAADAGLSFDGWGPLSLGTALLGAAGPARTRPGIALAFLAFACFTLGGVVYETRRAPMPPDPLPAVGARCTVDARVVDASATSGGVALDLGALRIVPEQPDCGGPWPGQVRLFVGHDEPAHGFLSLRRAGERLRLRIALRPLDGPRNPGVPDRDASRRRRGTWARATLAHPEAWNLVAEASSPLAEQRSSGRRDRAVERLLAAGPGGALLAALGLGATGVLEVRTRNDLRALGLSHLVAISGLHLGLLAGLGFAAAGVLVRVARVGAWTDPAGWKCGVAVFAALAYGWLSGFGVPVQRAAVALCLAFVLLWSGRGSAWRAAWCIAAAGLAAIDPMAVFELGPHLSFGVTAALASSRFHAAELANHEAGGVARVGVFALGALEVSAVALAASAMILAWHGMPSSPWALAANAVAVPITAVLLLPASLLAAALASSGIEAPVVDGLLVALAAAAELCTGAASRLARDVSLAGSVGVPIAVSAVIAICVVIAVRAPTTSLRAAAALACVFAVGQSTFARNALDAPMAPELIAFDVGQGDALLLRGPSAAILIDGGWADPGGGYDAGARVVGPGLRALGVRRLDLVVVTHADLDHRGGVPAALDGIVVDRLWLPSPALGAAAFDAVRARVEAAGGRVEGRAAGDAGLALGAFDIDVLWPPRDRSPRSANESSLVLRVETQGTRVLLMGDAGFATERALLASGADLAATVLKLGHHGSRTATSAGFLAAVGPEFVVVSAGCSVGRSLPDPGTLARVRSEGRQVLWTGRDGALRIRLGRPPRVHPFEPQPPQRSCRGGPGSVSALPLPGL